jgi:ubiquinone/menaquinone biosynthesis C-methylase UbiE
LMTIDEAIRYLRSEPRFAELVHDAYFDRDVTASAARFLASAEFAEEKELLGAALTGATIIDIGAGTGIAAYAFAHSGAQQVYAVEPDSSDEVGRGAIHRVSGVLPITVVDALADSIPLPDGHADIVYLRQVLHHIPDLAVAMHEIARVLKPKGMLLACREHVVDNEQQLAEFLKNHPIHQLVGGEHAYPLPAYLDAIHAAGLTLHRCIAPWDSIINAFPAVRSTTDLKRYPAILLSRKLGVAGDLLSKVPGVEALLWQRIRRPVAGRMYTFLASKA